jgi:WhiB family redox-sensing transcriptional regulator
MTTTQPLRRHIADLPKPREYVPMVWKDDAACKGHAPSLWYPLRRGDANHHKAVAICTECPVRDACLEHALTTNETHGIWGGLTEGQRKRVLQLQDRGVTAVTAAAWALLTGAA